MTLHPKVVLTARAGRPRSLNSLENDCVNEIRGRSSATTMHVRTHDRFTPFICRRARSHSIAHTHTQTGPSVVTVLGMGVCGMPMGSSTHSLGSLALTVLGVGICRMPTGSSYRSEFTKASLNTNLLLLALPSSGES